MSMILQPFLRSARNRTIRALYGAIVAQARTVTFYADYGVPDTVDGRFDLIVLHLVLLIARLRREGETGQRSGQALFDVFCQDLDDNLREMGVGDLAVPKRMLRFGEAFYGRQAAYLEAIEAPGERDFEKALARNIFQSQSIGDGAVRLARYARATLRELDTQSAKALLSGTIAFPSPETIANA
jgi:cytochrome b pre-mRNA-processing protein 3